MPKILDISYAGELGAANYILGIRDGKAVRFPVEVFQDEPIVNSSFVSLTDTPTNYVDQAGKLAAVNSTETGLEFIDAPTSLPAGGAAGQVLTKNSATDGDASWAEASGGTEIISSLTAPSSPVDGQLWIDESQGVQDQTNFIDVTNASTDYPLRRGETAVVNYSAATSVPLHIKTVEGVYEIKINPSPRLTSCVDGAGYLQVNNTTYTNGITRQYCNANGSEITVSTVTTDAAFLANAHILINSNLTISTKTNNKQVLGHLGFISSIGTHNNQTYTAYMLNTTTPWVSLGTITFANAQSGTVIIRRIY